MLESRTAIFVLSDFHDPQAIPALKLLRQEHDCVALQLQDPAERGRLGGGIFRAEEAESGRAFVGTSGSRWFDHEALAQELKHSGIDHLTLPIDQPFLPKLRGYLRRRGSFGKGAR